MGERKLSLIRAGMIAFCLLSLILIYVYQKTNYFSLFFHEINNPNFAFIFNKTVRLVVNDLLCVWLIFALFQERKYLKVALVVFLLELLVILPIYFLIKLKLEGDSEISSPLLSQIHRLVVNPMLMFILIAGFYYQKLFSTKRQ